MKSNSLVIKEEKKKRKETKKINKQKYIYED